MPSATRLRASAALAAILFIIGYFVVAIVPGGGDVTDSDFTKFYDSDGKMLLALLLVVALWLAAVALTWFFIELRAVLGGGVMTRLACTLGTLGAVVLPAGGAIIVAPGGVQLNSDAGFVGVPIAHAFAQAGIGVAALVGMGSIAIATILVSLEIRRTKVGPSWLGTAGIVLGVICLGSYIWIPGFAFPIWLLALAAVGLGSTAGSAKA